MTPEIEGSQSCFFVRPPDHPFVTSAADRTRLDFLSIDPPSPPSAPDYMIRPFRFLTTYPINCCYGTVAIATRNTIQSSSEWNMDIGYRCRRTRCDQAMEGALCRKHNGILLDELFDKGIERVRHGRRGERKRGKPAPPRTLLLQN